jgi:protein-tyrosine-phosphatase
MPRRVLFLCTGNYYRSRFAEVLFNHLVREAGLAWEADSCGLNIAALGPVPPGPISEWTVEGLKRREIALPEPVRFSRQVCEDDLKGADLVVAVKEHEHRPLLAKLHPGWEERVVYWHVHDLDFAPPEVALAELELLVRRLVNELNNEGHAEA